MQHALVHAQAVLCLLHQQGCAERMGLPVKFIHIAQILNGDMA